MVAWASRADLWGRAGVSWKGWAGRESCVDKAWRRFGYLSGLEVWNGRIPLLSLILSQLADLDSEPWCVEPERSGKFLVLCGLCGCLVSYLRVTGSPGRGVTWSSWKEVPGVTWSSWKKVLFYLYLFSSLPLAWSRFHGILLTYRVLYLPPTASSCLSAERLGEHVLASC